MRGGARMTFATGIPGPTLGIALALGLVLTPPVARAGDVRNANLSSSGMASVYSLAHSGRKTASGEIFDTYAAYTYDSRKNLIKIEHKHIESPSHRKLMAFNQVVDDASHVIGEGMKFYKSDGTLSEDKGLDYFYDRSPRDVQERVFRTHIAAARETGLPLVIHTREADEDCGRILEEETAKGPFKAVLHCYTGGRDLAMKAISLGLSISFTGILTFKNSQAIRDIAAELPADRIMVETDAPYLAPGKYRGKRNEPSFVTETARVLAETRGVSVDEIARQTTENFFRLFDKVPRPDAKAA